MAQNSNVVIIPSAGLTAEEVLSNSEHAIFWIRQQYENGTTIASICSGSFLLAEAGGVGQ